MAEHHLELTIKGTLDDAILDALFTAGCDDTTLSNKGDLILAAFNRNAPTMLAAVISAIDQVESVNWLEVLHVDPDELVWASEIAQRVGRTRQSVEQLINGQRGPGGFPSAVAHATRNPLWADGLSGSHDPVAIGGVIVAGAHQREAREQGVRWGPGRVILRLMTVHVLA